MTVRNQKGNTDTPSSAQNYPAPYRSEHSSNPTTYIEDTEENKKHTANTHNNTHTHNNNNDTQQTNQEIEEMIEILKDISKELNKNTEYTNSTQGTCAVCG